MIIDFRKNENQDPEDFGTQLDTQGMESLSNVWPKDEMGRYVSTESRRRPGSNLTLSELKEAPEPAPLRNGFEANVPESVRLKL